MARLPREFIPKSSTLHQTAMSRLIRMRVFLTSGFVHNLYFLDFAHYGQFFVLHLFQEWLVKEFTDSKLDLLSGLPGLFLGPYIDHFHTPYFSFLSRITPNFKIAIFQEFCTFRYWVESWTYHCIFQKTSVIESERCLDLQIHLSIGVLTCFEAM